jgi:hypothetical protein
MKCLVHFVNIVHVQSVNVYKHEIIMRRKEEIKLGAQHNCHRPYVDARISDTNFELSTVSSSDY